MKQKKQFYSRPRAVSPEFRALVQRRYPGLDQSPVFWRLMQHLLFPTLVWWNDEQFQLLTHQMMGEMVGRNRKNINVPEWVDAFQAATGIRVYLSGYRYTEGIARTVHAEIDGDILTARDAEAPRQFRTDNDKPRVDFVTGVVRSRRTQAAHLKQYHESEKADAALGLEGCPTAPFADYLNGQGPVPLESRLERNWKALWEAALALPADTPKQKLLRDQVMVTLIDIAEDATMVYHPVAGSVRLFTKGHTIHCLPRELRGIALSGDVFLDLKNCQLAVVAMLWQMADLRRILETEKSFWVWVTREIKIELTEETKQVIKDSIYPILFGMAKKLLMNGGKDRHKHDVVGLREKLGLKAAQRFIRHPVIKELLKKREEQYEKLARDGGGGDAFGQWVPVSKKQHAHAVCCSIVQSYEMKLMMAMLPILQEYGKDVRVHSFLHDGAAVSASRSTQEEGIVKRIVDAIQAEARRMDIPTSVEVKR